MWMDLCILESFIRYSPVTIKHIIDSTRALLNPAKAGYSSDLEKDVLAYTITLHCLDWSRSSLLGVGDCYCWVERLKWRPSNHYALICLVRRGAPQASPGTMFYDHRPTKLLLFTLVSYLEQWCSASGYPGILARLFCVFKASTKTVVFCESFHTPNILHTKIILSTSFYFASSFYTVASHGGNLLQDRASAKTSRTWVFSSLQLSPGQCSENLCFQDAGQPLFLLLFVEFQAITAVIVLFQLHVKWYGLISTCLLIYWWDSFH